MPSVTRLDVQLLGIDKSDASGSVDARAMLRERCVFQRLAAQLPNLQHAALQLTLARPPPQAPLPSWNAPLATLRSLQLSALPPFALACSPLHLAPMTALSALQLTYGTPGSEVEAPFTAARASDIARLPSLRHLSLTLANHGFEQVAADALAAATQLTSFELLRHMPTLPMNFFDFHLGVRFIAAMTGLRRLKLNDTRFVCQGREVSWDPLTALSTLECLAMSGMLANRTVPASLCMVQMALSCVVRLQHHTDVVAQRARKFPDKHNDDAGAHLSWKSYAFIASLTALTSLQLAHCSGTFQLPWLAETPLLRRLYLKGNGPGSTYTMVTLVGGYEWLTGLQHLEELYMGLVAFVEADGASSCCAARCIS
jgi:hypothetical protein